MLCCTECFVDNWIRDHVQAEGQTDSCDFCGATDTACVMPSELEDLFDPLLQLYTHETPSFSPGETLGELIDMDWEIFAEARLHPDKREELLDEIVNGRLDPRDRDTGVPVAMDEFWRSRDRDEPYYARAWDDFVEHIRSKRRYVLLDLYKQGPPDVIDPASWLPVLLEDLATTLDEGEKLYRARIGSQDSEGPYPTENMGLPPPQETPPGRANPRGIPVFYMATDQNTAIAEVRPWKGALVSVAECQTEELLMANLLDIPHPVGSPFQYGENLHWELEKRFIVRKLAAELERPISPRDSDIEYVPTQYLTEVIQAAGYDGVIYPSAMGKGNNVVLFDPRKASIDQITLKHVVDITYGLEDVSTQ